MMDYAYGNGGGHWGLGMSSIVTTAPQTESELRPKLGA